MAYNAQKAREFYDVRAQKEWDRLDSDACGRLMCVAHLHAIQDVVSPDARVLELGAGAGRFSVELARLTPRLSVTDISPSQLEFNRRKMTELGLGERVECFAEADICDLSQFQDESFDAVVCIGGALNYVFEKETQAMGEMLRVLAPAGVLLLGVMSLRGVMRWAMGGLVSDYRRGGLPIVDWLLRTGQQDEEHYAPPNRHYVHMMREEDVRRLCRQAKAKVAKTWCGGFLAHSDAQALQNVAATPELWNRIVEAELELCQCPGLLEAGTHMLFAIRKQNKRKQESPQKGENE
ncbi:MAG: class I SAM-dependent methyltransferase [Phycisphaerae bacterium]|jgi:ubiquinone/menaquinone biosynthesis C-methylase UbiE